MNQTVENPGTVLSRAPLKAIATASLLVGLSAVAIYAGLREHRSTVPQESVANQAFMADPQHPALSAEEEIYAAAMWPIHSEVKLAAAHASYRAAIADYAAASRKMLKVVADGRDEHLVNAHRKSERAGVALLTLSDALWPGEYKPN